MVNKLSIILDTSFCLALLHFNVLFSYISHILKAPEESLFCSVFKNRILRLYSSAACYTHYFI